MHVNILHKLQNYDAISTERTISLCVVIVTLMHLGIMHQVGKFMKIIHFSPSQSVSAAKELLLSSGVPCNRFLPSNSKYYLVEKWTEAP